MHRAGPGADTDIEVSRVSRHHNITCTKAPKILYTIPSSFANIQAEEAPRHPRPGVSRPSSFYAFFLYTESHRAKAKKHCTRNFSGIIPFLFFISPLFLVPLEKTRKSIFRNQGDVSCGINPSQPPQNAFAEKCQASRTRIDK